MGVIVWKTSSWTKIALQQTCVLYQYTRLNARAKDIHVAVVVNNLQFTRRFHKACNIVATNFFILINFWFLCFEFISIHHYNPKAWKNKIKGYDAWKRPFVRVKTHYSVAFLIRWTWLHLESLLIYSFHAFLFRDTFLLTSIEYKVAAWAMTMSDFFPVLDVGLFRKLHCPHELW